RDLPRPPSASGAQAAGTAHPQTHGRTDYVMTSTKIDTRMPTRRLLSGCHVPADLGEITAPIDVVDRPRPEPAPKPEPTREPEPTIEQPRPEPPTPSPAPAEAFRPEKPIPAPAPVATSTTTP